jgi:hypothetical protein
LADAKRKNIAPFSYQAVDFGQNDKGIFGAKTLCTLADDGHEIFLLIWCCCFQKRDQDRRLWQTICRWPWGARGVF